MRADSFGKAVRRAVGAGCVAVVLIGLSLYAADQREGGIGRAVKAFAPVPDQAALHNGHVVTERVISGAQPEGEASFEALRALGVKTIISVDGARPDVEGAKKYGMRYVHLPITYGEVTPEQGKALAKAMVELPGPVYVHCHHGKHRSAAAVAVGCVYNGSLKPEQAEAVLKTFGTGANYQGLWKAAREARRVDSAELRALEVEFVESAEVPPLAEAMVDVDRHADHLKAVQKAGWRSPADHPDLNPAHEALQLMEHLRELGRAEESMRRPADFRRWLGEGERAAGELRGVLAASPVNAREADAALGRVTRSCTDCHGAYRD